MYWINLIHLFKLFNFKKVFIPVASRVNWSYVLFYFYLIEERPKIFFGE